MRPNRLGPKCKGAARELVTYARPLVDDIGARGLAADVGGRPEAGADLRECAEEPAEFSKPGPDFRRHTLRVEVAQDEGRSSWI